ncbi:MAG: GNAT family protein [Pseudomonadota bacterium]|nr:GNAT family protein [Pseudomonadota bacterium]MEE3099365.1 GNAT family protein [Pseudomonadota bacterium]
MPETNAHGQPVGDLLPGWTPPPFPPHETLAGRFVTLEPLSLARHGADLWDAARTEEDGSRWTYLPVGPFTEEAAFLAQIGTQAESRDPLYFAIRSAATGRAEGFCSLLRITPAAGSIEVGFIWYGPRLARSPAATEAQFLLAEFVFGLGYRRHEWKCDAFNAPSRAAAMRYGFSYEGLFRQAVVVKGRNRDTAWYAMTDGDWAALRPAYAAWLAPENFDAEGRQKQALSALTGPLLKARG